MPLTSPAFPLGPYRFINREYLIITYRTDPVKLRAVVPEPLEIDEQKPLVKYEFIRMPDSSGFGDYTESGQVIPVSFHGRKGSYSHCMFLNDEAAIAGGRDCGAFQSSRAPRSDGNGYPRRHARLRHGAHCHRHHGLQASAGDHAAVLSALGEPNFLLKIIPHVDGDARICELVEYHLEDIAVKGAWTGPAALDLTVPRLGAAGGAAGARGCLGAPPRRRPDARSRQGRA